MRIQRLGPGQRTRRRSCDGSESARVTVLPESMINLVNLRHLTLHESAVKALARNQLKKALPGCRITVSPTP